MREPVNVIYQYNRVVLVYLQNVWNRENINEKYLEITGWEIIQIMNVIYVFLFSSNTKKKSHCLDHGHQQRP